MMDFIKTYFIDFAPIPGGIQVDASYTMIVLAIWVATWKVGQLFKKGKKIA